VTDSSSPSTRPPLTGRTAIVTGAARGIGTGVTQALLTAGAGVVMLDRDDASLRVSRQALDHLGEVAAAVCDVSDRAQVDQAIQATVDRFAGVDILVNNAQALRPDVPLAEVTASDFALALDSGLWGTFNMMQASYPHLSRHGGAVINFASSAGLLGQAGLAAYAAAKEAIRGLSRVAAREWGRVGITVNVICPAALSPSGKAWADMHPDLHEEIIRQRAVPRDGDPVADIGAAVVFLSGAGATFISGETITVNGGYPLRP
jgi:NAD(P)-dependent dehydrogenase (short-subunit alcohol dehydrogenase family)